MKGIHHPNAVFQNRGFALNQIIRGQPAIADANAHRAACRMEPQPDFRRSVNGVFQPRPVGINVKMIRTERTPRQRQFRQPHLRGGEHVIRCKARPNRIERLQPAKQQRILTARHSAGQGLVKVMMGVHQARRDHTASGLYHRAVMGQRMADLRNHPVVDQHVSAHQFAAGVIHGQDVVGVADQNIWHLCGFL